MTRREVPDNIKETTPLQAVYQILRAQHALMDKERSEHEATQKKTEKAICEVALALFNFQRNRQEWTENTIRVYQTVDNALRRSGVEVIDYTGRAMDDELLESVIVEGWEPGDGDTDMVKETFTPEIRFNGALLHQAQVFCLSARQKEDAAEEAATEAAEEVAEAAEAEAEAASEEEAPAGEVEEAPAGEAAAAAAFAEAAAKADGEAEVAQATGAAAAEAQGAEEAPPEEAPPEEAPAEEAAPPDAGEETEGPAEEASLWQRIINKIKAIFNNKQ